MAYLLVFFGAGFGGALRHGVNVTLARLLLPGFPLATLTVNVLGSLVMGLLAGYFAFKGDASHHWRLFLTTGILGGFTTFSTFSLDVALLWERSQVLGALVYVLASSVVAAREARSIWSGGVAIECGLLSGLWMWHFRSHWPVWWSADQVQISHASYDAQRRQLVFLVQICSIILPIRVAPIDKLSVVLVAIFATLFLRERLSGSNWLGVALIAIGAVFVALK